jgi:hypothetical protein
VVWFRDGAVVLARSDQASALLGTMAVDAGVVARSDLERALTVRDEQPERGRRIGEVLLEMGAVSAQALEAFLRDQIHRAVEDLLGWEGGAYEFQESEAGSTSEMGPAVPVAELLGEGPQRAPAPPVSVPLARETVSGLLRRLAQDTDGQSLGQEDRRVFLLPDRLERAEHPVARTRRSDDGDAGSAEAGAVTAPSEPAAGGAEDGEVLETELVIRGARSPAPGVVLVTDAGSEAAPSGGRLAASGAEGLAGELTALTGAELPVSLRVPGESRAGQADPIKAPHRDPQVTRDVLETVLERLLEL